MDKAPVTTMNGIRRIRTQPEAYARKPYQSSVALNPRHFDDLLRKRRRHWSELRNNAAADEVLKQQAVRLMLPWLSLCRCFAEVVLHQITPAPRVNFGLPQNQLKLVKISIIVAEVMDLYNV